MGPANTDLRHPLLADSQQKLQGAREHAPEPWERNLADARVRESLPRVWACSEFAAKICERAPAILGELVGDGSLFDRREPAWFAQDIARAVHGDTDADLMESLRRFRKRHMLRIAWRDIAGWADLDETLSDLSALADACIELAYTKMYAALTARYGTPRGAESGQPQPLMIL